MTRISSNLLDDTLNLIQLARETARIQGQQAQAERLTPVVDNLRTIVGQAQSPAPTSGILQQNDFKTLLAKMEQKNTSDSPERPKAMQSAPLDRSNIIVAMAAGGMTELDIARQFGMSREEVRLTLSVKNAR